MLAAQYTTAGQTSMGTRTHNPSATPTPTHSTTYDTSHVHGDSRVAHPLRAIEAAVVKLHIFPPLRLVPPEDYIDLHRRRARSAHRLSRHPITETAVGALGNVGLRLTLQIELKVGRLHAWMPRSTFSNPATTEG